MRGEVRAFVTRVCRMSEEPQSGAGNARYEEDVK